VVTITPDDTALKATFTSLTPSAPAANDPCNVGFSNSQLPWPPSPDAIPPTAPCGTQRPGINIAPAIAPDGTIYTASRAHLVTRYNYLVAVNPDLRQSGRPRYAGDSTTAAIFYYPPTVRPAL